MSTSQLKQPNPVHRQEGLKRAGQLHSHQLWEGNSSLERPEATPVLGSAGAVVGSLPAAEN